MLEITEQRTFATNIYIIYSECNFTMDEFMDLLWTMMQKKKISWRIKKDALFQCDLLHDPQFIHCANTNTCSKEAFKAYLEIKFAPSAREILTALYVFTNLEDIL